MTASIQDIERHYREYMRGCAGELMTENFVPARDLRAIALHFFNRGEERRDRLERRQADRELRASSPERAKPAAWPPITEADLSQKRG